MTALITRFRKELLDAPIDLGTSSITQEHDGAITVTALIKPPRRVFGAVFALPCLYLLGSAVLSPNLVVVAAAVIFCPVLAVMALVIGWTAAEKSIDRYRGQWSNSLRLLGKVSQDLENLPMHGEIALSWRWEPPTDNCKGYDAYTIAVSPAKGLAFTTINDYGGAREFAQRLGALLSFPLHDLVPESNRGGGRTRK